VYVWDAGPVTGFCTHDNELSVHRYVKGGDFLDYLCDCQVLKILITKLIIDVDENIK
jgi:hypothetical protein